MIMKVACFFAQHSPMLGQLGFLADGHEFVLAHDALRLGPFGGAGSLHADPRRLAQYWRVGAVCLFRVALPVRPHLLSRIVVEEIEYDCHLGQPRECAGCGHSAIQANFVNSILCSPTSAPLTIRLRVRCAGALASCAQACFRHPSLAFGTCRRASTTFRVALRLVFRSFRQIRPDRIGGRGGLHRNLKQNEWHAREGLGFSWSGTNAA